MYCQYRIGKEIFIHSKRIAADIPKDTLITVLSSLPVEMKHSYYGSLIKRYIDTKQIGTGDVFQPFSVYGTDSLLYNWSENKGKYVLLIYGGLSCMGEWGRNDLVRLRESFPRDRLEIIVYQHADDIVSLCKAADVYNMPVTTISDFLGDASPIRILYGAQATPTCIFVHPEGYVLRCQEGFSYDSFSPSIEH